MGAFRLKKKYCEWASSSPSLYGVGTKWDDATLSITISRKGGDMRPGWLDSATSFFGRLSKKFCLCVEVGARAQNMHIQGVAVLPMASDKSAKNTFVKELKDALMVTPTDQAQVMVRIATEANGEKILLGYVQKDRNKAHYRRHMKGFTEDEMREAYEAHISRERDPSKKCTVLNKSNLLRFMFRFHMSELHPLPPPTATMTITYMINSGDYTLAPIFAERPLYNLHNMESLWRLMHFPHEASSADLAAILYGRGDPGDEIYGEQSFAEAARSAQEERAARLDHFEETFEDLQVPTTMSRTLSAARKESEGYIPLETAKGTSRPLDMTPPMVGSLACPRVPFEGLSPGARNLMQRKRLRLDLERDLGLKAGDSVELDQGADLAQLFAEAEKEKETS